MWDDWEDDCCNNAIWPCRSILWTLNRTPIYSRRKLHSRKPSMQEQTSTRWEKFRTGKTYSPTPQEWMLQPHFLESASTERLPRIPPQPNPCMNCIRAIRELPHSGKPKH